ncbi:hypothetical protein EUGRSUZ_K02718 [Eucalyptus grandis]|uniref:Uncharacterized protein n=2 Tax=Eucalyptus grandis TaxID=71139 RepID=A0ACC3IXR1_EUCGR|nr:hypothetical protein EUGRSUZ_K02718 [Eucalyptus grandis]
MPKLTKLCEASIRKKRKKEGQTNKLHLQYLHNLPAIELAIAACITRTRRNKPELSGSQAFRTHKQSLH